MLDTNLNVAPFFDDFDETKNFHRILFKPTTPVQARELNQIQTILQNQIERFGNSIYKDGAVINGCNISFYPELTYVRLQDTTTYRYDANNEVVGTDELIDVNDYIDKVVKCPDTGLMARILTVKSGSAQKMPYTNRLYVKYMNSGRTADGTQVQTFQDNDTLDIYENPYSAGRKLVTTTALNGDLFPTISANGAWAPGVGYGISTGEGLIYQKGFFIRSETQTLVISDTINPGNTVIGFTTN
jgi:hypothetical protein